MEKLSLNSSLADVLAIGRAYRSQVHEFVTHITIHNAEHIKVLFQGSWPKLERHTCNYKSHKRGHNGVGKAPYHTCSHKY